MMIEGTDQEALENEAGEVEAEVGIEKESQIHTARVLGHLIDGVAEAQKDGLEKAVTIAIDLLHGDQSNNQMHFYISSFRIVTDYFSSIWNFYRSYRGT